MSTPMQIDSPQSLSNGQHSESKPGSGVAASARVSDVIDKYRPTKQFRRQKDGSATYVLSFDFDDSGDLCMSSESDESIQIYNVRDGKHSKECLSKKYGVKLAKFSRTSTCVIYASTKENDTLRYLSTHDNSFIRYFKGHEAPVTCIAPNPGADTFMSCSEDNTVRIWDTNSDNAVGRINLAQGYLAAFDPSATVMAVASEAAQTILLYDFRNFDKEPFASFDLLSHMKAMQPNPVPRGWNRLEFSNDGKHLLVGTTGGGHYLLDAFKGELKSFLQRNKGGTNRLGAGQHNVENVEKPKRESTGDVMFSPDGRYVLSGQRHQNVLVYDTMEKDDKKRALPVYELEHKGEAAVMSYNPRYHVFVTGDRETLFWVPDPNAD